MPGSAVLDPAVLVDGLVDVIDGLRDELHPLFGVRPFFVDTVLRSWSGGAVGAGSPTDVAHELRPQPAVDRRIRYEMTPAGKTEVGVVVLTEVSLTYTYAELTGGALSPGQQWLYRLREAHGQGAPDRYYVLGDPPYVDREEDMGWVVTLRAANVRGCP